MPDANAVIATNRFGLGARPGELARVGADPQGWLLAQLRGPYRPPAELASLVSGREVLAVSLGSGSKPRANQTDASPGESEAGMTMAPAMKSPEAKRGSTFQQHYAAQAAARTRVAIASEASFRERLVHFWSNHFAVSVDKEICLGIAGAFENEAIRPHVTGRFVDLLRAVERHPAMLGYLDNALSAGPNSTAATAQRRRIRFDTNENLAREILELHTLGVDGGYTQADVGSFAKVLSGWSIGGVRGRYAGGEPGAFVFRDDRHEPGVQTILGKRYGQPGIAQGDAVLDDLARHPATARHISTKLARHFIGDEPPVACVERVARAFRDSDGDLQATCTALVRSPEAWHSGPAKFKSPADFVFSSYRGLGVVPSEPRELLGPFELLGQRHWSPGSPAGWPDTARDWDGSDALIKRAQLSLSLAEQLGDSREPDSAAQTMLGATLGGATRTSLRRAASRSQAVALLLMSPEFQRR